MTKNDIPIPYGVRCGLEAARIGYYAETMTGEAEKYAKETHDACVEILAAGYVPLDRVDDIRRIMYAEIAMTAARLQALDRPYPTLRSYLESELAKYRAGVKELEDAARAALIEIGGLTYVYQR